MIETTGRARRWVCLDIGETLIDETRVWTTWAHVLGVTPLVLHAALGAAVAAGGSYPAALGRFDPKWSDRFEEFSERYEGFKPDDLYPDVLPSLAALAKAGLGVAVIGNQPASRTAELRAIGVTPEVMVMSEELGVSKPDAAFYDAVVEHLDVTEPDLITYVGDRVDNDILPAIGHGLRAIHLRRGPWGIIGPQDDGTATAVADSLGQVVQLVSEDQPAPGVTTTP